MQGVQITLDLASLAHSLSSLPLHERLGIEQDLLQLAEVVSGPTPVKPHTTESLVPTLLPTTQSGAGFTSGHQLVDDIGEAVSRTRSTASNDMGQSTPSVDEELEEVLVRAQLHHSQRRAESTHKQPLESALQSDSTGDDGGGDHHHEFDALLDELLD